MKTVRVKQTPSVPHNHARPRFKPKQLDAPGMCNMCEVTRARASTQLCATHVSCNQGYVECLDSLLELQLSFLDGALGLCP